MINEERRHDEPVGIDELVRRAFRLGLIAPMLGLATLLAVAVPVISFQVEQARAQSHATVLEGILTDRLASTLDKVERLARLQGAGATDPTSTEARISQLRSLDPTIRNVLVADAANSIVGAVPVDQSATVTLSDTVVDWFAATGGEPFVSPPYYSTEAQEDVVVLAVPVRTPRGAFQGTVQVTLTTAWITDAIVQVNQDLGSDSFVTDPDGRVIAHGQTWRLLAGQEMATPTSGLGRDIDGALALRGIAEPRHWDGSVMIVATTPVGRPLTGAALGLVPMAFVSASLVARKRAMGNLVDSVVDPVRDLERSVREFGPDNLASRAPASPVSEVNEVAIAFNRTADTVNRLIRSLRSSNQQLQEFASVAAHDLQEPVRKIRAYGDMLADSSADDLDDQSKHDLERMLNAAARMQQLINDLLTYARIGHRIAPSQRIELNAVVAAVLDDLEHLITESSATVDVGRLPSITADPVQMHQLFLNLISNGVKYHKPDDPPTIKIHSQPSKPGTVRVHVDDDGIGFDDEQADQIFKVFARLHGRSSYEGTGIGLAICRRIVERHGGVIVATGQKGAGASFIITLPLRTTGELHVSQTSTDPHGR